MRPDDLTALVMRALLDRHPKLKPDDIDDVIFGCTNQAGEDNRNVARMGLLLAGLPITVTGVTVNRLCGSGLQAIVSAAQVIMLGDADATVAGGAEVMSRVPYWLPSLRWGRGLA